MGRRLLVVGLVVALLPPLLFWLVALLGPLMPHCTAGSAPTSGCEIYGINLNWLVSLSVLALMASFVTVPVGGVTVLIALIVLMTSKGERKPNEREP